MKFCKYFCFFLLMTSLQLPTTGEIYVIDAAKNSATHNNKGIQNLNDGFWAGAIQEFKIAIALNPNSQAAATYFDNLGRTYMKIFHYPLAQDAFENAVRINPMCFQYYLNLAEAVSKQNKINSEIAKYKKKQDSLSKVMLGVLYIKNNDVPAGKTILDEFCTNDPSLILTEGIKDYLKSLKK